MNNPEIDFTLIRTLIEDYEGEDRLDALLALDSRIPCSEEMLASIHELMHTIANELSARDIKRVLANLNSKGEGPQLTELYSRYAVVLGRLNDWQHIVQAGIVKDISGQMFATDDYLDHLHPSDPRSGQGI